jgi:hypothetical protein
MALSRDCYSLFVATGILARIGTDECMSRLKTHPSAPETKATRSTKETTSRPKQLPSTALSDFDPTPI